MSREYPREDDSPDRCMRDPLAIAIEKALEDRSHRSIDETLKERGETYGKYVDIAEWSQRAKDLWHSHPNWKDLPAYMRETIDMECQKNSRVLNGDPFHVDNWHDKGGYNLLTEDCIRG